MNRRQLVTIIGISFLALLAGVLSSHWMTKNQEAEREAVKAVFSNAWITPDGTPLNTQEWSGKVIVLNFWASWCPPCVEEIPQLEKLHQEFSRENVLFVGIAIDSPSNVREFLKNTQVSYPIAMGGVNGAAIYKGLGNTQSALPYTALISPNGEVISTKLGKIDEDSLRKAIKSAL